MLKIILTIIAVLLTTQSYAAILVFSPNGTYTTKTTLEAARTAADAINKTVTVTSALTQAQSNITGAWPADRGLDIRFGGSLLNSTAFAFTNGSVFTSWQGHVFKGAGTITGIKKVIPQWFGAVGDGTTNDNAAIQNAMICAESNFENYSNHTTITPSVRFPKGKYLVTGLTMTKPLSFVADNPHEVALITATNDTLLTITITGMGSLSYVGVTIENLSFIGSSTGSSQNGIVFSSTQGIHYVRNCELLYFGNNGLFFGGAGQIRLINNRIFFNKANGAVIQGVETGQPGYLTWSEIKSNAFSYNQNGLWLKGQVSSIHITDNLFESNNAGSGLYGSATRTGIGLKITKKVGGSDYENFNNSHVSNNYFEDNWCGIYAESMYGVTIGDSNFFDSNVPSITAFGASDGSVTPFGQIVVLSSNTSSDNRIVGNNIQPLNSGIGANNWSVVDATTIKVTTFSGLANLIRYKTGSYIVCENEGVLATVSNVAYTAGEIIITVDSTAGFIATKPFLIFTPQIVGFNGASKGNIIEENHFVFPGEFTYVDPEGVYDGQCLLVGARAMRRGLSNMAGVSAIYEEKVVQHNVHGLFSAHAVNTSRIYNTIGAGGTKVIDYVLEGSYHYFLVISAPTTVDATVMDGVYLIARQGTGTSIVALKACANFTISVNASYQVVITNPTGGGLDVVASLLGM